MRIHTFALAALSLAAALALPARAAPQVMLEEIGSPVAGQSFDLQLTLADPFGGLAADEQLLAYGFHLNFDAASLSLGGFVPAAGWQDDSAHAPGNIFSASVFPGIGNSGQSSLVLGTLHFDALRAGATPVSLATDAGDLNQGLVYLESAPLAITAGTTVNVSAVPEPANLALLLAGLGIVGWRARRR